MAEGKNSFVLYVDQKELWEEVSDEQAGKLIKHIFKYVSDENPECPDQITKYLFIPIKNTLKRDLKKYEKTKRIKRDAGIVGNLKRWHPDLYNDYIEGKISLEDAVDDIEYRKTSQSDNSIANVAVSDSVSVSDIKDNINIGSSGSNLPKEKPKLPTLEERKLKFKKDILLNQSEKFDVSLMRDFFIYWSEHGEGDKKMRFEKEKTFGIKARLHTWWKNKESRKLQKEKL